MVVIRSMLCFCSNGSELQRFVVLRSSSFLEYVLFIYLVTRITSVGHCFSRQSDIARGRSVPLPPPYADDQVYQSGSSCCNTLLHSVFLTLLRSRLAASRFSDGSSNPIALQIAVIALAIASRHPANSCDPATQTPASQAVSATSPVPRKPPLLCSLTKQGPA
ncbi:hypothetical protein M0802_010760 [Mischocyttarus mexicanus]|nr:hypothetical protein M0802_010760 [Mischocyttarus mexicanus]